jgi:hypothetical protein
MEDGTDTNGSSQNSLNAIVVLELCADVLPTAAPMAVPRGANPSPEGGG